ncbi:MAG: polyprenyl synthetase family protein [Lachnospiraceae bacterium]|nr:polyprenyl synthetase family protein [Lachnospiraceae bacterium]
MDFEKELTARIQEAEDRIYALLPKEEGHQKTVLSAMNYAVRAGGKRLRPVFMGEAYRLFLSFKDRGYYESHALQCFMAAIECIHTYSLIHDDLPAMDNDELRRGKPSTWKQYGEAMGILAGDALLNFAAECTSKAFYTCEGHSEMLSCVKAQEVLFRKAGIFGMIGGQVLDVESEGREFTKEELFFILENKTAALIEASLMAGGYLASAGEEDILKLEEAGKNIGLAFQIQDDLLDIYGSEEALGKPIHSDDKNEKNTYVSLFGAEKSRQDAAEMTQRALAILRSFPQRNVFLETLVESLLTRNA